MHRAVRRPRLTPSRAVARRVVGSILGSDSRGRGQSLAALAVVAIASVVAGLVLGSQSERLEALPGLLLMVPAATALRGNVFGALGSRLGTSIHAGTFRLNGRATTVVGANVWAAGVLALGLSVVTAGLAKFGAGLFGVANAMAIDEFVVVSVVGGLAASAVVLSITLALAAGSVRFGWDPDNVTAPLVTAAGDLVTLPALMVAAGLVGTRGFTIPTAAVLSVVALAGVVFAMREEYPLLRHIVRESLPVLVVAGVLELLAGATVENQLEALAAEPALLVVLPGFLAAAGALGGILSSRLSSKIHLGLIDVNAIPDAHARPDLASMFTLAIPIFAFTAVAAHLGAGWFDLAGPGFARLVLAVMLGGIAATVIVAAVAYYATIFAVRFGLDPDTYGIPLVTSTLDLTGALTFVVAIEWIVFT